MIYYHTDVFSAVSFAGNGLTVIFTEKEIAAAKMQKIAQEFKQFETIFLQQTGERQFRARIFTVEEELDFAGHPLIGAAAAVHDRIFQKEDKVTVSFVLNRKNLETVSERKNGFYQAVMNQGKPEFLGVPSAEQKGWIAGALNLKPEELHAVLMPEVISTGLPYLIVPVSSGLEHAGITVPDLEERLKPLGAKFVYLIDPERMEGRTWDNFGAVEDVATGSAAGPVGAYLCKYGRHMKGGELILNQGRYVGRPSQIRILMDKNSDEISVAGDVTIIAAGEMHEE